MQERLLAAGFLTGAVDGRYGDGTQKAVSSAQAALREKGYELAVDGIAGQQTLTLLLDDQVMEPFLTFGLGASGPRVISLQKRLIDLKFLEGQADGCFGQQTQDALKAFRHIWQAGAFRSAAWRTRPRGAAANGCGFVGSWHSRAGVL